MDTIMEIELENKNLINENIMLKNQLNFLIECINNQMKNLELLCEKTTCNLIHKSYLKPYYQKSYKCEFYL
jgi:L-lysine 2,3-aminomutase